MSKKMTPAMRLWRDENMEAIREGVRAVKEGRFMPADTFFEWMRAKYVRDIWDARIARLQARVEETKKALNKTRKDDLEIMNRYADERDALQARVEELDAENERIRQEVVDQIARGDRLQAGVEEAEHNLETHLLGYSPYRAKLDRYKALAERRKRGLEWLGRATARLLIGIEDEAIPLTQALEVKIKVADDALESARTAIEEEEKVMKPTIVCLCGSTRFMDAFQEWGWKKTLDGEIVLSVGASKYLPSDHEKYLGEEVESALDELHKRKIDLADYIFVLNVGGYIGDSTRSEIEYAESLGMRVDYLEAHPG